MGEEFFVATLSRSQRVTTVVGAALMVLVFAGSAVCLVAATYALHSGEQILMLPIALSLAPLPVLLFVLPRFAPVGYAVSDEGIAVVRRNGQRIDLPKYEIRSVEPQDRAAFRRCIRGCGVGGYFGSWGYFWSPALKGFRAYITDIDNAVLVRTRSKGQFVLTPDDRDGFVAHSNEVLGL